MTRAVRHLFGDVRVDQSACYHVGNTAFITGTAAKGRGHKTEILVTDFVHNSSKLKSSL